MFPGVPHSFITGGYWYLITTLFAVSLNDDTAS